MRDLQSKLIPMFFLQPKSPASFYGGSNLTVALRQDRAQVIMKIDRGIYALVDVIATDEHHVMVMCQWGGFMTKHLTNPEQQIAKFYDACPELRKALTGASDIDFIQSPTDGFGKEMPMKHRKYIFCSFFAEEVIDMAREVMQRNLIIYHEVVTKIPFPQWRHDIKDFFL